MTTHQYAVLDPSTGIYTKLSSPEAALDAAATVAVDFFLRHTHGQPFAKIDVADDGTETWASLDGVPMLSPAQIAAEMESRIKHMQSFASAGVIPTTTL